MSMYSGHMEWCDWIKDNNVIQKKLLELLEEVCHLKPEMYDRAVFNNLSNLLKTNVKNSDTIHRKIIELLGALDDLEPVMYDQATYDNLIKSLKEAHALCDTLYKPNVSCWKKQS